MTNLNQCFDSYPDKRDYDFNDFIKELVRWDWYERPYNELTVQNQWQTWACSRFWLTHLSNWQNIVEYLKEWEIYKQRDAMEIWNESNQFFMSNKKLQMLSYQPILGIPAKILNIL